MSIKVRDRGSKTQGSRIQGFKGSRCRGTGIRGRWSVVRGQGSGLRIKGKAKGAKYK